MLNLLVDLALTGQLALIVIFLGLREFRVQGSIIYYICSWPAWMGSIDFTALKIKLLGSIVAISAIQLLKQFMAVEDRVGPRADVVRGHSCCVRGVKRAARPVRPAERRGKAARTAAPSTTPVAQARRKAKA